MTFTVIEYLPTSELCLLKPYLADVPILYPLKKPEKPCFSYVFRGYIMGTFSEIG